MLTGASMEWPPGKVTGISTSCFSESSSKQWTRVSSRSKTTVIFPIITIDVTFKLGILRHVDGFVFSILGSVVVLFKQFKEKYWVKEMVPDGWLFVKILIQSLGNVVLVFGGAVGVVRGKRFNSSFLWLIHVGDQLFYHHWIFFITFTTIFLLCLIVLFVLVMMFLFLRLYLFSLVMGAFSVAISDFDCFFDGGVVVGSTHFLKKDS